MRYSTILFGGIGTLVETSQIQLDAFNRAFAEIGVDFVWQADDYQQSLIDAGGQRRLSKLDIGGGRFLSDEEIADVHAAKTRLFNERIIADGLSLRPGVAELLAMAGDRGLKRGWVTTTATENIEAICRAVGRPLSLDLFDYVGHTASVDNGKPAPDIYEEALAALEVDAGDTMAIEDSPTGVASAKAAGLFTLAYPGAMHTEHDFSGADQRVDSLSHAGTLLAD